MIDWNILNFWLSKTDYIQTLWNQPIHQKLLEKNRDSDGKPVPTLVVLAGGEQSGKSSTGGNHCYAVAATPPQSLVWIVGERYHDCHQDFEYMVESGIKTGVLRREDVNMPQEGQWTATFRKSGTVVKTLSSGDVTTLHQEAPDGIMMVEAGRQTRQAFDTLWVRATHKRAWFLVSGCLSGDTYILTTDGIIQLNDLPTHIVPYPISLDTPGGAATLAWRNLPTDVIRVGLKYGFTLEGTPDHNVQVMNVDGYVMWKKLTDLNIGDYVLAKCGLNMWGTNHINSNDAYFAGLYIAEGCCSVDDRITITTSDSEIEKIMEGYGYHKQNGAYHWRLTDHSRVAFLKSLGIDVRAKASKKAVPQGLMSADRETVIGFLQGLFDGDGCAHKTGNVSLATSSKILATQVQQLLLNFGIVSGLASKIDHLKRKEFTSYVLSMNSWSREFYNIIGFRLPRKQNRQGLLPVRRAHQTGKRIIRPNRVDEVRGPRRRKDNGQFDTGRYEVSPDDVWENAILLPVLTKEGGFNETFDLHIPTNHWYVANGVVVHNTFEEAKGRWYPDLFKECLSDNKYAGVSLSLPTYANPILYPEGPNDPKILALRKTLSEEQFAERILGQPRPSLGVVFPEFRRSVHVKESAEYDPGYPVVLWVDPGFFPSSYAVLWTQIVGEQVRIFNEFYLQLTVTDDVLTLVENYPQFPKVERIVIDIAAEAHAGAMDPAASAWRIRFTHRGRNIPVVSRYVKEEVGRARIHDKLRVSPNTGSPGLILHPRCENSIYEFEDGYKFHVRSSTREIGSDKPQDRNNHSIKAIAYGLVDKYGAFEGNNLVLPQSHRRVMAYDRVLR